MNLRQAKAMEILKATLQGDEDFQKKVENLINNVEEMIDNLSK